jgi:hypothetical protein
LVAEVARLGPAAAGSRLQFVVDGHRKYADATNDPYSLVRMFNRLAEVAKEHDPEWAVALAEEALAWNRGDDRNWKVLARCLWSRAERLHLRKKHSEAEIAANEAFDVLWEARFRFAYDDVVRNELARLHRDAGDLETAAAIYRETRGDFPEDIFCRTGLAEVLRLIGGEKVIESKRLYRDVIRDFATHPGVVYAFTGLGELLLDESAASRDEKQREESRALFQQAADLHNNYATNFLKNFDQRWQQRVAKKASGKSTAFKTDEAKSSVVRATPDAAHMGPAERLGRALLAQWHGKRSQGPDRDKHFAEAERLLSLDDALTGECYAAFIEARGLLFVAREEFSNARDYFDRELQRVAPERPLGLRLGLLDARQRLGEPITDDDESLLQELGPEASLLVAVLKIVRLLQTHGDEELLRRLLLEIYPRVRELAVKLPDHEQDEHAAASPDRMLASLLQKQFFEPVGIASEADLADVVKVSQLRNPFSVHGRELSSSLEKLILSLSA